MPPLSPLHLTRLATPCLFAFALLAATLAFPLQSPAAPQPPASSLQPLWSAASDNSLWIVRAQTHAASAAIYFRLPGDPPDQLRPLLSLSGRLAAPGIAASPQQLWLLFSNGSVTSLGLPIFTPTRPPHSEPYVATPLPRSLQVLSLAACRSGLWVLAHPEDEALPPMQQLNEAENALESPPAKVDAAPPTSPSPARKGSRSQPQPPADPPAPPTQPQSRDQLFHLAQAQWTAAPLPTDWPTGPVTAQLISDPQQDRPTLIAQNLQREITLFTPDAADPAAWSVTPLGATGIESWRAVAVRRQVVLAERTLETSKLAVRLWLARASGLTTLATLDFPDLPPATPWTVTALSDRIAVIASRDNKLYWSTCDLTGRELLAAQPLVVQTPPSWLNQPDVVLVTLGLVVASLLVVYILVRRASGAARVPPPGAPVFPLASLAARGVAALIDFAPCFAIVFPFFPAAMSRPSFDYWPGRSGTWTAMIPGLIVIALFVLHTALSEWRFGCSLGKRILRLRVLDISTLRPQSWQILLRNLLKILDLIVPPLLVILVVSPWRQRLGDLVAQTVVASTAGPAAAPDTPPAPDRRKS